MYAYNVAVNQKSRHVEKTTSKNRILNIYGENQEIQTIIIHPVVNKEARKWFQ